MKYFPWKILGILIMAGAAGTAEPSVYGRSYGNTDTQTVRNSKGILSLRQEVNRMQEEIDGLKSIIESLSGQINELRRRKKMGGITTSEQIKNLEERVSKLEESKKKSSSENANRGKGSGKQTKNSSAKKTGKSAAKESDYLKKAPSDKLFSRGVRLINQKRYSEAKKRFDILLSRNYKAASSNFYMGEIFYHNGRYDDAVIHYQKSAELNENAAYMDRLLLHTGIALEKSGDREQARNFFQAIVDGYPGTASAKTARKHLK